MDHALRTRYARTVTTGYGAVGSILLSLWFPLIASAAPAGADPDAQEYVRARLRTDFQAMAAFRASYPFWQHIFTIPDGAIAFGSATDGRLLATFPISGEWSRDAVFADRAAQQALAETAIAGSLADRRDVVARLLEGVVGPVVHNPTRGLFYLPNARRYGALVSEWSKIYERFGVPGELGLAQALTESGLNGTVRSNAGAIGLCQWLRGNWRRLQLQSPVVIEAENQTTQAAYCAAYLTILAARYGSFIPALSEHHAGGTNVGRTLINGERLGGASVRERYFLGAAFARELRVRAPREFSDLYGTYGPRSFTYAEMVFGNVATVKRLAATAPQSTVFAMRTRRAISLDEVARRSSLSIEDVRRFNPALTKRVAAGATVYLPFIVPSLGRDVSFWHRPATAAYATVLSAFVRLDASSAQWDDTAFDATLERFRERFAATRTDEGVVMATMLAYVLQDRKTSGQREILSVFRTSSRILQLFNVAQTQRTTATGAVTVMDARAN